MDRLESRLYYGVKEAIRKVESVIGNSEVTWHEMPIVLIDFYVWEAKYFEDVYEVIDYVQEEHVSSFDEAPEGKDEELVVLKYCTQYHREKWVTLYKDYKFYKKVNGVEIYRKVDYIAYAQELVINVHV